MGAMKECKARGEFGDKCRGMKGCLLAEDPSGVSKLTINLPYKYNCPKETGNLVRKVLSAKISHLGKQES